MTTQRKTYGIAVFHHIGDVLCCTPIAKQLKFDDPDCHITWFTSEAGEVAVRHNPYIDELVVVPGDQYLLDREFGRLKALRPWTRFFTPAAYLNYDAVPGGSIYNPKGTVFGLVKAGAQLHWTVPFIFPFVLAEEEKQQARAFVEALPAGKRILVETEFRSEQSVWTDDFNFDLLNALRDCNPVFVFTSRARPDFLDRFSQQYSKAVWCSLPFRLNAEVFNLCDAYVGVSSGVSCLTYSEYCRTDIPRIEVTRGEHWGAADLQQHSNLMLCYTRTRYLEALNSLRLTLLGQPTEPDFSPRARDTLPPDICPSCGMQGARIVRPPLFYSCANCDAVYASQVPTSGAGIARVELLGPQFLTKSVSDFEKLEVDEASISSAYCSGDLGSVAAIRELFEKLQYSLKPGGSLELSGSNFESILSASLENSWPALRPETSHWLLTGKFLRNILIQAGFWIEETSSDTPADQQAAVLQAIHQARPDLDEEGRKSFAAEINRRGAGERLYIRARKRGGYKGRVREQKAKQSETPRVAMSPAVEQPIISVIVPHSSTLDRLYVAVESALTQNYSNLEVLIVHDQDSSQFTKQLKSLSTRFPDRAIRLIEGQPECFAEALDLGVALSTSKLFVPLHADDCLHPEFLTQSLPSVLQGADVVFSYTQQFGDGERVCGPDAYSPADILAGKLPPLTALVSKGVWQALGGYNAGLPNGAEALHFWMGCLQLQTSVSVVHDALYRRRVLVSGQPHHSAYRHWRYLTALVRTLHPELFAFERLVEEHQRIQEADEEMLEAIEQMNARFPGLSQPHFWKGLVLEGNGLFEAAISAYDASERRRSNWQAEWRKLSLRKAGSNPETIFLELQQLFPEVGQIFSGKGSGTGHGGRESTIGTTAVVGRTRGEYRE